MIKILNAIVLLFSHFSNFLLLVLQILKLQTLTEAVKMAAVMAAEMTAGGGVNANQKSLALLITMVSFK